MADRASHLMIEGRVQGVGFRYWLAQEADRRGLRGWVRNRYDGTVEALIIGEPAAVTAMIEACRHGPRAARVTRLNEEAATDDGTAGFGLRPTV